MIAHGVTMNSTDHIKNFSLPLTEILNSELEFGNEIVETSDGWPSPNSITIFLRKPFFKEYSVPNLEFRDVNDPHWWKSEYFDERTNHILACKYD
jgi:hypothetical protein